MGIASDCLVSPGFLHRLAGALTLGHFGSAAAIPLALLRVLMASPPSIADLPR